MTSASSFNSSCLTAALHSGLRLADRLCIRACFMVHSCLYDVKLFLKLIAMSITSKPNFLSQTSQNCIPTSHLRPYLPLIQQVSSKASSYSTEKVNRACWVLDHNTRLDLGALSANWVAASLTKSFKSPSIHANSVIFVRLLCFLVYQTTPLLPQRKCIEFCSFILLMLLQPLDKLPECQSKGRRSSDTSCWESRIVSSPITNNNEVRNFPNFESFTFLSLQWSISLYTYTKQHCFPRLYVFKCAQN